MRGGAFSVSMDDQCRSGRGTGMTSPAKLLSDLVALPSVNAAFLPADNDRAGERQIAEFLASHFKHAGLDVQFQSVCRDRSNLLARLSPPKKVRCRILLAPHLDTVNGSDDQFRPRVRGGRMYGRGACDTKGSIAAMAAAICELAQVSRQTAETEIIFAGLVDEEDAQRGSRALAASGLRADLAIIGEPTKLKVVTAHKGSLWLRLETRGKAAHGARPELGRNAVHAMARIVDLLQTDYAARLAQKRHPLLGCATVSVGTICGGVQPNIVPDRCGISVDRRTLPGETLAGVWRDIRGLLRRHGLQAACLGDRSAPCFPLETDPKLPLVKQFLRSAGQARPAGVHYFCDAAVLARGGIPSIVFGPGDIAQAHTADEWISLGSLDRAKAMLVRFLQSLG
jgi:acetylornithine deacetylase/succinyl-diaminopimelate desuccinylase-like protein